MQLRLTRIVVAKKIVSYRVADFLITASIIIKETGRGRRSCAVPSPVSEEQRSGDYVNIVAVVFFV